MARRLIYFMLVGLYITLLARLNAADVWYFPSPQPTWWNKGIEIWKETHPGSYVIGVSAKRSEEAIARMEARKNAEFQVNGQNLEEYGSVVANYTDGKFKVWTLYRVKTGEEIDVSELKDAINIIANKLVSGLRKPIRILCLPPTFNSNVRSQFNKTSSYLGMLMEKALGNFPLITLISKETPFNRKQLTISSFREIIGNQDELLQFQKELGVDAVLIGDVWFLYEPVLTELAYTIVDVKTRQPLATTSVQLSTRIFAEGGIVVKPLVLINTLNEKNSLQQEILKFTKIEIERLLVKNNFDVIFEKQDETPDYICNFHVDTKAMGTIIKLPDGTVRNNSFPGFQAIVTMTIYSQDNDTPVFVLTKSSIERANTEIEAEQKSITSAILLFTPEIKKLRNFNLRPY